MAHADQFKQVDGKTIEGCSVLLDHPSFSHTRMGTGCWRDVIWVYHYDQNSPSGFILVGSTVEETFKQYSGKLFASPLSPTEPR